MLLFHVSVLHHSLRPPAAASVPPLQIPNLQLLPLDGLFFVIPPNLDGTPGLQGTLTYLTVGDPWVEPGYIANDDRDDSVQQHVVRRYAELVDTTGPTPPNTPFAITYDVKDVSGNAAITQVRASCALLRNYDRDGLSEGGNETARPVVLTLAAFTLGRCRSGWCLCCAPPRCQCCARPTSASWRGRCGTARPKCVACQTSSRTRLG